jgi:hypothetical protein
MFYYAFQILMSAIPIRLKNAVLLRAQNYQLIKVNKEMLASDILD